MSITRKQLDAAMAAESRLVSMGVLCPQPVSSLDAEWLAAMMKASQECTRTGLPVRVEYPFFKSIKAGSELT